MYNAGVKYWLTVIDVFSKYGWKPKKLWVDKGRECYNKDVKKIQVLITMYSTENEEKSSVVERWLRTTKRKMFKYFSTNATRKYIDVTDKMVEKYNNTKHSSIKMTPVRASLKKNEAAVWMNKQKTVKPSVRP